MDARMLPGPPLTPCTWDGLVICSVGAAYLCNTTLGSPFNVAPPVVPRPPPPPPFSAAPGLNAVLPLLVSEAMLVSLVL